MRINHLISTKLTLCFALCFFVFSSLAPFGYIHDTSHREYEDADFHLHIIQNDGRNCGSADKNQQHDDHHLFDISHGTYTFDCAPIYHQYYSPDKQVNHLSHKFTQCSPLYCFINIPPDIIIHERGSPTEILYPRITLHFLTDLSPPLG